MMYPFQTVSLPPVTASFASVKYVNNKKMVYSKGSCQGNWMELVFRY